MIGNKLEPFKFWCQKVLPNVYDDSLSYYEYLCKLNEYLNEVIEQINTLTDNMEDYESDLSAQWTDYKATLNAEWLETKNYIDNYFNNLNVQTEINNKLDAMASSGELSALLSPIVGTQIGGVVAQQIDGSVAQQIDGSVGRQIDQSVASQIATPTATATTAWLTQHVDPVGSAVIVDDTLTISGAAADAKVSGDRIGNLELGLSNYGLKHNSLHLVDKTDDTIVNSSGVEQSATNFIVTDAIIIPDNTYSILALNYVTMGGTSYRLDSGILATYDSSMNWIRTVMPHGDTGVQEIVLQPTEKYVRVNTYVSNYETALCVFVDSAHVDINTVNANINKLNSEITLQMDIVKSDTIFNPYTTGLSYTINVNNGLRVDGSPQNDIGYLFYSKNTLNFYDWNNGSTQLLIVGDDGSNILLLQLWSVNPVQQGRLLKYNRNGVFVGEVTQFTEFENVTKTTKYKVVTNKNIVNIYDYTNSTLIKAIDMSTYGAFSVLGFGCNSYMGTNLYYLIDVDSDSQGLTRYKGKVGAAIGDSFTSDGVAYQKYPYWVMKYLGLSIYDDVGVAGSTVTTFASRVNGMRNNLDLVTILGGTNDYSLDTPIGVMSDRTTTTFYGALHSLFLALLVKYPNAEIVIATPTQRNWTYSEQYPFPSGAHNTPNGVGATMYDYRDAILEVAEYYGIKCIDLFKMSGITAENASSRTIDGLHPTPTEYEKIGWIMANEINNN